MTLALRRQDSAFIPDWDRDRFWCVFHKGVCIGAIVAGQGRSDEPARSEWTIHLHAGRHGNGLPAVAAIAGSEATREAAMRAFRSAFDTCLSFIGAEGWAAHAGTWPGPLRRPSAGAGSAREHCAAATVHLAMLIRRPNDEKLVLSEFSGRLVPMSSEAWRHECEVAFFLGLPLAMRNEMLEGVPNATARDDHSVKAARGEAAVAMLRAEIARLAAIRLRRIAV